MIERTQPPPEAWPDGVLRSPQTGRSLRRRGPFLEDASRDERWPVVEEIPYLRVGREQLRRRANESLASGNERAALAALLTDRDDWAPGPPPEAEDALEAVRGMETGAPAREAMRALGFGPVADYFTYRLSDPTYLGGLALLRRHWNEPLASFELACGIGHYTRELSRREVSASAGDVVFAKLWLARRYLVPEARLVCFDASAPFPLEDSSVDLALCQDAFYFLPDKPHAAAELRRIAGPRGTIVIGHSHNSEAENLSAGSPLDAGGHEALFPDADLHDDAALTRAALDGTEPPVLSAEALRGCAAVALGVGESRMAWGRAPDLALPPPGTPLRPGPLYAAEGDRLVLRWPSERYEAEYAPGSGYLPGFLELSEEKVRRAATQGFGSDPEIDRLARIRALVDQPEGL